MFKKLFTAGMLLIGTTGVYAADHAHQFDFNSAVQRAVADGTLDGSVKFYLAGNKTGGKLIQANVVTNKKTNGFAKSAEESCDWVLRSALIQLQNTAQQRGGNAVTNIVSYYKSKEMRSTTSYECHKGMAVTGLALKGNIVKF
ncbi:excinuclease [Acinetobacter sp. HY1485]|uniref:excinuclease n=1 Tax=Acinetobacter sp. HY1485 TaxID=2970918 RepID=UPI0022B9D150|nr:excinuclease [Acinetobacter sp. HY1485]